MKHSDIDHSGLGGIGSTVTDATIATTDVATNNASTSKHGWMKKLPNDAALYYDGTGNFSTPPGGGASDAADVAIADAGALFVGTDVEAGMQELAAKVIGYLAHGNAGAAETFDAAIGWHSATLNANCTITLTGATAGLVASMILELTEDGTGGFTIDLPASVVEGAALEAAHVTTASTSMLLVLVTRDGGTTWHGSWLGAGGGGGSDDLDVIIGASSGQDIADALAGAAAPDAGNVFATMADVGGGGGAGGILGAVSYSSGGATAIATTNSATPSDIDATNCKLDITVPASGKIAVMLQVEVSTTVAVGTGRVLIRTGSTNLASLSIPQGVLSSGPPPLGGNNQNGNGSVWFYLTGLTPGALTIKAGFAASGASGSTLNVFAWDGAAGHNGPLVMIAFAA